MKNENFQPNLPARGLYKIDTKYSLRVAVLICRSMGGTINMFSSFRNFAEFESAMKTTWAPVYKFSSEFVQINARDNIIAEVESQSTHRAAYWNNKGQVQESNPETKRAVICNIPIPDTISQSVLG